MIRPTFAQQLCAVVEAVRWPCDECVAVEAGPYYSQCLFNRDTIYGEVISNMFLDGAERLSPAQERRLLDLGWLPPDAPCHPMCAKPHPNFHRLWPQDATTDRVVHDLLVGLTVAAAALGEGGPAFALIRVPRVSPVSAVPPPHH